VAATNINVVVLTGNLTRDPELRSLPSGMSVCSLRIASNTRRKGQSGEWEDKANYFDVTVWGAQGENCARFLSKGRPVALNGRLEWREWQAQDGQKRQSVEIIADSVQFLGGRDDAPRAAATASRRSRTSRSTTATSSRRAHPRAAAPPPRTTTSRSRRRAPHPFKRLRSTAPGPFFVAEAGRRALPSRRVGARLPQWTARAPLRARIRAPPAAPRDTQHTKGLRKWQSSAAGRRAGVTRRVGPAQAAGSPASTAGTRSTTSITRTSRRSGSSSATGARSARAASRAPAAGTRTRSRPAVKRAREIALLPYVGDTRENRDERGRPQRDDRDRDRDR
jgi:single-strand DNA-binding protein